MNYFSQLLDVIAYDERYQCYIHDSNYLGSLISCQGLTGVNTNQLAQLKQMLAIELPANSYLSFCLYADDNLEECMQPWQSARLAINNQILDHQQQQIHQQYNQPHNCKDFLLYVSLKTPCKGTINLSKLAQHHEHAQAIWGVLQQLGCNPHFIEQHQLLRLFAKIFSDGDNTSIPINYEAEYELKQQLSQTSLSLDSNQSGLINLGIGEQQRQLSVLSCKAWPSETYLGMALSYLGDPLNGVGEKLYPSKLMISVNVLFPADNRANLENKRKWLINQRLSKLVHFMPQLEILTRDYQGLFDYLEQGDRLCKASMTLILWHKPQQSKQQLINQIKAYWSTLGINMLEDKHIALPLLINSLPLGVDPKAMMFSQRYKTMAATQVVSILPIYTPWKGNGNSLLPLQSRQGQLMFFDLFASLNNFNAAICAQSGAGKSFLVNELVSNLLAVGGQVWIIDIGKSYSKLAKVIGGVNLEFDNLHYNLNPFKLIDDYQEQSDLLFNLLLNMININQQISDLQINGLRRCVDQVWQVYGKTATIDHLLIELNNQQDLRIRDLTLQLHPFSSQGSFAHYFNGDQSGYDPQQNLTILELESLNSNKHLQKVVLLELIMVIQQHMMLKRNSRAKVLIIDEAWDLLQGESVAKFIETAYRRFRKYQGSVITITQNIEDLSNSIVGQAIVANCAHQIFLSQKASSIQRLFVQQQFYLEPAVQSYLLSLQTIKGKYSELYISTNYGQGLARLVVSRFQQLLYTTDAIELTQIESYCQQGFNLSDAIMQVIDDEQKTIL